MTWARQLTDEQLDILGVAMRQRRVYMGECLAGSRNKPPAHDYWTTKCGVLDLMLKDVEGEVDERRAHSTSR